MNSTTTDTADTVVDVMAGLEELLDRRRKLAEHLDQVEAGARTAVADLQTAREQLGRLEADAVTGSVTAKERAEVERALDKAQAVRDQPWPERLEGARAALLDAGTAIRVFAADHIDLLITNAEQSVEPHVVRVNQLAAQLDWAIVDATNASRAIPETLQLAAIRPSPNAFPPMQTDELRQVLARFLAEGGQEPIVLDRRHVPALAAAEEQA